MRINIGRYFLFLFLDQMNETPDTLTKLALNSLYFASQFTKP